MSQLEQVYGVHAVEALLRHHPRRVKQLWLAEGRQDPRVQTLVELATQQRISVGQRERRELDEWAEGVHQGVVAEVVPVRCGARRCLRSCWIAMKVCRCCWCWMG